MGSFRKCEMADGLVFFFLLVLQPVSNVIKSVE